VIAVTHGPRLQLRGVGPACRFGDAEGLQPQLTGRDPGQVSGLLFGAAMAQHRSHRVHLRVGRAGVAAGCVDLLQYHARGAQGQTGAAIAFRDQRRQEAGRGHRGDEVGRIAFPLIQLAPIGPGKVGTDPAHAVADLRKVLAEFGQ
jgi:hypothetical protein